MSRHHDAIKRDPRWRRARLDCLHRDGYECVTCHTTERLQVDHIIALAGLELEPGVYSDEAFDLGNLQTLCRGCHDEKGRRDRAGEDESATRWPWVHPAYAEALAPLVWAADPDTPGVFF